MNIPSCVIRLKSLSADKHASLFVLSFGDEEGKSFVTLTPGVNVIKLFPLSLMTRPNKLECLPLETLSSRV
jgi:hypothetical protein